MELYFSIFSKFFFSLHLQVEDRNDYISKRWFIDASEMLLPSFGYCDVLEEWTGQFSTPILMMPHVSDLFSYATIFVQISARNNIRVPPWCA